MRDILIINGHPDPSPDHLTASLADAYGKAAATAGHAVRRLDIGAMAFALLRAPRDFLTEPDDEAILSARRDFLWAHHLVFIFPLWLGGLPAAFKAFLEQLARAEFVLGADGKGFPVGKLKGRSARVIVTMGMPAPIYRIAFGAHGVKAFNRGVLGLAGIRPVRTSYFGGITDAKSGAKAIAKARLLGARGA